MGFVFTAARKSRITAVLSGRNYISKVKSSNQDILDKLRAFLDKKEPKTAAKILSFWKKQQDAVTYKELREACMRGDLTIGQIQNWQSDYAEFINEELAPEWREAIEISSAEQFSKHPDIEYQPDIDAAQEYISTHGAELVTRMADEQTRALQSVISYGGFYEESAADELSRVIRPLIGLTEPQSRANMNYYEAVKRTLTDSGAREKTAAAKARDKAAKYAERQHRYRAMCIARTELAKAYNAGGYGAVKAMQMGGYIGVVDKVWITAGDERICGICGGIDGDRVPLNKPFSIGVMLPPAHPNCRCAVAYEEAENSLTGYRGGDIMNTDESYDVSLPPNDDLIPRHKPYEVVGRVNPHDKAAVDKVIREFENAAVGEKIETACVVALDGTVYKCYGTENEIFPNSDLGYKIIGSVVSHNHPINETEFSFSKDDLRLFKDYNLKRLRGCDEKYTYELTNNADDIDKAPKVWQTVENFRHSQVISEAKKLKIGYRRWKR